MDLPPELDERSGCSGFNISDLEYVNLGQAGMIQSSCLMSPAHSNSDSESDQELADNAGAGPDEAPQKPDHISLDCSGTSLSQNRSDSGGEERSCPADVGRTEEFRHMIDVHDVIIDDNDDDECDASVVRNNFLKSDGRDDSDPSDGNAVGDTGLDRDDWGDIAIRGVTNSAPEPTSCLAQLLQTLPEQDSDSDEFLDFIDDDFFGHFENEYLRQDRWLNPHLV